MKDLAGIPFCDATKYAQTANKGSWKIFKDNGYAAQQDAFPYALFKATEAEKVFNLMAAAASVPAMMKFGSSGEWVKELQEKLIALNYLKGTADGDFGTYIFNAAKQFQTAKFGKNAVDCIVGHVTSAAVGIASKFV